MEHHTDARELAQAVFISGVEARTLLQAAAWLNELDLQSLYLTSNSDIFGAVCAKKGQEGPVHLMQIDTFTAAANQAGLLDPKLSCRDGSSCLTERCSRLLDVVPPGESCDGCTALSGGEWDTALMQLQQRIARGSAVVLRTQHAVGVHTSIHQVATTMTQLYSLQRCYQLLLPLHQMLAAHGHTISQLPPVVKELPGISRQQRQQQDTAGEGSSKWALGLHQDRSAASLRPAAEQAVHDTLPYVPQQQYGVLLDLLATTLSNLQDLSVASLLTRALNMERKKQQLIDAHNLPATQQQQLQTEQHQQPPDQQHCQPLQVLASAQQQSKLLVKQDRQPTARLKRSAADTTVVDSSHKLRRVSNHDSPRGVQQQQAALPPAVKSAAAAATQSPQGLHATPSTPPAAQRQQQLQPQLQSPFSAAVDPALATPATPAVASSRPKAAVTPRTPSAPQQQAVQRLQPQVLLAQACSSDMEIDNFEPVNLIAAISAPISMKIDEAGSVAGERIVDTPHVASGVAAIPAVQSSSQTAQVPLTSPTPQVPATPASKKPQPPGTSAIRPDGRASRTAVNLCQRLDEDFCTESMKQSPEAGSTGQRSSVGSKGSAKATAAVLPTSAAAIRELRGQPDMLSASPAAAVPKDSASNTELQQQKQQLADETPLAAAVAANRCVSRSDAANSLQAVSGSAATAKGSKTLAAASKAGPKPGKAAAAATKSMQAATVSRGPKPGKAEAAATKSTQAAPVREGSKPAKTAATTGSKLAAQATAGSEPADAEAAAAGASVARPKPAAQAITGTKPAETKATGSKPVTVLTKSQPAEAAAAGLKSVSRVATTAVEGSKPARCAAAATGSKPANNAAAAVSRSRLATDRLVSAAATTGAAPSTAAAPANPPAVKLSVAASGSARPSPAATAGRGDTGSQAITAGDSAGNHRHHRGMTGSRVIGSSSGPGRTAIPAPAAYSPPCADAADADLIKTLSSTTEAERAMKIGRQYHDSNCTEAEKITVAVALHLHDALESSDSKSISVSWLTSACPELPADIRLSPPAVVGYLMQDSHLFWQDHTHSKQDPYIGLHEKFRDMLLVHPWVWQHTYKYRKSLEQAARDSEASGSVGVGFGQAGVPPLLPKELLPIKQLFKPFYHFVWKVLERSDLMIVPHFTSHNIILKNQEDKYIPQLLRQDHIMRLLPQIADTLVGRLRRGAQRGYDVGVPRLKSDDAVELLQEEGVFKTLAKHFQVPGFFTALMTETSLSDTFWWGSYTEPGSSGDANSHDGDHQHHVTYIELRSSAAKSRGLGLTRCGFWKRVAKSGVDVSKCRNGWRCWFCHAPNEP